MRDTHVYSNFPAKASRGQASHQNSIHPKAKGSTKSRGISCGSIPLGLRDVAVEGIEGGATGGGARFAAIPELEGRAHGTAGSRAGVHVHRGHDCAVARIGDVRDVALDCPLPALGSLVCARQRRHVTVPHLQTRGFNKTNYSLLSLLKVATGSLP